MNFLVIENFSEAVNPVYRRRRLAKIMQRSRFHKQNADHWAKVSDTLDNKHDKLVRDIDRKYGRNKSPEHQKIANDQFSRINARRGNAQDNHIRSIYLHAKAWKVAKGSGYNDRTDKPRMRLTPANPLRKNRDETRGKHKITVADMKRYRAQRISQ